MNAIPMIQLPNKPCHSQFNDQDWSILAQHWYPVARVEDVSQQPQQVTLLDLNWRYIKLKMVRFIWFVIFVLIAVSL